MRMSLSRIALLSVVLIVMTSCQLSSAIPRLNNAMLWKRLGLNRAIGAGNRPQITSTKKKGESTVYFIKLPPQPHFYIPFNLLPSTGYQKSTPEPFETVSVDFTANGKPENVYHWNLPLSVTVPSTTAASEISTTTTSTSVTSASTTTTPTPEVSSTRWPANSKKPYRHSYYNNGKPHKLYFVKPSYAAPSTTSATPINEVQKESSNSLSNKKQQYKKHFYGNGKPNQLFFMQPDHLNSHSV